MLTCVKCAKPLGRGRRFGYCLPCERGRKQTCIDCGKALNVQNTGGVRCHKCGSRYAAKKDRPCLPVEAGNAMVYGAGERFETCTNYTACLRSFSDRSAKDLSLIHI